MSRLLEKPNIAMSIKSSSGSQLSSSAATAGNATALSVSTSEVAVQSTTETITSPSAVISSSINNNGTHTIFDEVFISLVSGSAAGALAKTTIAPLDRTKINFQISKNVPYSFKAAIAFLRNTYEKEGILALWRGNSATMARIVPYAAIQFTAHEQWRKILQVDKDGSDTKGRRFIAGSLAGITSQSLTYPLDLARARMAVTDKYTGYKTLRQVFVKIWVEEGPRTLYRGYFATVLGVIPYAGVSFFTYGTLKREYYEVTGNAKPNTLVSLAFGAVAGAAGQTSSYPLDIVRRRMQTMRVNKGTNNQYRTIYSTLKKIYKEEGIKNGFYKGLSMNWIKGPIAVGISFSAYDLIKELLRELFHLKRGRYDA
ncbi:mitochondrial coenzyme A transporter SLC25A42 [Bactrocera tryoni]|uniref:mitochondrial coenzyme A transporter SLC25A42 n=1 Tax=Bactrocera tryoni TaxID=59916 RepID=UPI001A97D232|nr:mitochondrial coenzyme A transporter SLC25A42 [Bactrocera tryoni]XP_039948676.1 mitochondrial coenzyme A transporter SLC25A42 [Bactrocera tryoni]